MFCGSSSGPLELSRRVCPLAPGTSIGKLRCPAELRFRVSATAHADHRGNGEQIPPCRNDCDCEWHQELHVKPFGGDGSATQLDLLEARDFFADPVDWSTCVHWARRATSTVHCPCHTIPLGGDRYHNEDSDDDHRCTEIDGCDACGNSGTKVSMGDMGPRVC